MLQFQAGDLHSLSLVGSGGFGLVYRGWSETLGMEVALKMLQGARENNLKDFMKERDMMHTANYTYVLRLLGVYEKPEGNLIEYGLVIEYMPLGSLCTLFENVPDVPWALRFQILHQVVLGMNFLHRLSPPIIHRDLKPGNVLFNKSLDVQLTDFGLAKFAGSATTTSTDQSIVGTLAYMPPEAIKDINYKPTKMFDVYSFGILTWSVLSGQEPYPDARSFQIMYCIPNGDRPDVRMVDKCLTVKMVPEAKKLMIKCWDGEAKDRPSFQDLKVETVLMSNEYVGEIDSAIREVLDLLKNPSASAQVTAAESSPLPDLNAPEFLETNFAAIVQAGPDLSNIWDILYTEGIINGEEQSDLDSIERRRDQVRKTLRMIRNKGQRSSTRLLQLLEQHHPSLATSMLSTSRQ
ncbi:receptor-interacting serine/threonine-protein kinase 3-like isoform X1 [Ascaphus truei]|uniref:receptor-interacting serine/threonine-protein kinase 3-like isoform X1 n=2 Tax=Ascaphus truei TaxID=8439 RepID=UPI003F59D4DA